MPELPDLECFRLMAERHFLRHTVSGVAVSDPAALEGITGTALDRDLKGHRLERCERHGKVLFLDFGDARVVVMHFGPAGALRCVAVDDEEPAYTRVRIDFSADGDLAYVNRRRIGRVRLTKSVADFIRRAKLGPDVMDADFTLADFTARLDGREQPIKLLLMDQAKLAGIGNTWSDEILFQARVRPTAPAGSLDANHQRHLFRAVRETFRTAIDLDPTKADFLERLPSDFLLPRRHPDGLCPRCGKALEQVRLGGHTSTFCPHCQR